MDSVDCSFSSLPSRTRSRRNSAALPLPPAFLLAAAIVASAAALAAAAVPAAAQPVLAAKPARSDSVSHRSSPFHVMLRSAAVPGWGQLYNHKVLKAGLVVAGEGFIVFEALHEFSLENRAVDRQVAILEAGGDLSDPAYILAGQDKETHRNLKITWIWWGLAAHLLSMADAYVDAHLANFDADFGPPETAADIGEKPRLTLAFRTRF